MKIRFKSPFQRYAFGPLSQHLNTLSMLEKRQKQKYVAVDNEEDPVDFEQKKRSFCNHTCFWSSLFTSILIGTYYVPSIGLTFYQRWLLQTFHFPLITVLIHMVVKYLLAALIRTAIERKQNKQRVLLGWKEYVMSVAPVGIFSGFDIGFSNWGLELIQVSLYTMTKSTTIVFILGFSILFKLEKKSWSLGVIVSMITLGLILFTYKATQFNLLGFLLLLFASMSSGVRWTCVQLLLQKSKMGMSNPIDMIYHMQPWMIASLLPFALWLEGRTVIANCQLFRYSDISIFLETMTKILVGAFIAFFMEVCEVLVVCYTSSLTLSVAGIVKEVLVLVLAVEWNGDQLSRINVLGLLICLSGITCHVLHKLNNSSKSHGKPYESYNEHQELVQKLVVNESIHYDSSESDDKSDTQILFNVLNNRDR